MVLGSPCSQEPASGAGSSRRRPWGRSSSPARRGGPSCPLGAEAALLAPGKCFAEPHAAALIAAARTLAPIRCMCRATGAGEVQDEVGLPFSRRLAYEHTRLRPAVLPQNASQSCIQRRSGAYIAHSTTERPEDRAVASAATTKARNPSESSIQQGEQPWLRASSASASWAKAWPAAF